VSIHLGIEIQRVACDEDEKLHVEWRDANGSPQSTTSSRLLVATGKTVDLTELQPDSAAFNGAKMELLLMNTCAQQRQTYGPAAM
jgi:hypothetical protein